MVDTLKEKTEPAVAVALAMLVMARLEVDGDVLGAITRLVEEEGTTDLVEEEGKT